MSKRISLREYQEGVVARLKSLATSQSIVSKLGIQAGNNNWLVDLADVSEVLPVPEVVALPLTQRWFRGVTNIRGNLYSVVDLPNYLGEDQVPAGISTRLLLVHQKHIVSSALLVNRMLGLRNIEQMTRQSTDNPDPNQPWVGDTYQDDTGRTWRELKLSELVQQPGFLQTGLA